MIVVTAPTGKIGSQLIPHLLTGEAKVRVIVRDPAKLPPQIHDKVEVVKGSTDEPAVLTQAFEGAEAVFWLIPSPFNADDVNKHYLRFAHPAADAILAQDVKRVVAVSGLRKFARSAQSPLSVVEGTGVAYRALWCAGFMENLLGQIEPIKRQGAFFMPVRPDVKMPLVSTRDIAVTAARLLLDKSWTGQGGLAVMGPEDLSYNDMTKVLSDVLGKPIRFQQISGDAFKQQLTKSGASEAVAQWLIEMLAEAGEDPYGSLARTPENMTPTTFRDWCEQVLKPLIQR